MEYAFVNSIFASIQGEGMYAGIPAIFLRFQGCKVNCPFCDTKNSWEQETQHKMTVTEVVEEVTRLNDENGRLPLLVLTGGEPTEQFPVLELVVQNLYYTFPRIQLETSGYIPFEDSKIFNFIDICLSPKQKMAPVLQWYTVTDTIKFLVGKNGLESPVDLEWVLATFPQLNADTIFLQPIDYTGQKNCDSLNYQARNQALRLAMQYKVRISLQMHKILNIM